MKIVMTGSSGFIGKSIKKYLKNKGHRIVCLVRRLPKEEDECFWDPYQKKIDPEILKGCDVVINLAGESIRGRWTSEKKKRIYDSRILSTRFLVEMAQITPPKIFIQASAIGYYGDCGEKTVSEEDSAGGDFLARVCKDWEGSALPMEALSRLIFARFGVVLSPEGGALRSMLPAFKMGLGGKLGSGRQYMSWIALEDLLRGLDDVIHNESLKGAVNFVSPFSIKNEDFTNMLGKILHRPTFLSVPEWVFKKIFLDGSCFFFASAKVEPRKLMKNGFIFQFPDISTVFQSFFNK